MQIYRTYDKLETHTCKLEVNNPTSGSYYTKNWVDGNGCNTVYCENLGQEVVILHCEKCVSDKKSCCKSSELLHLPLDKYAKKAELGYRDILWPKLTNILE